MLRWSGPAPPWRSTGSFADAPPRRGLDGQLRGRLKLAPVTSADPAEARAALAPGQLAVTKKAVFVGTATAPVRLGLVRPHGRKEVPAADWARGVRIGPDERWVWMPDSSRRPAGPHRRPAQQSVQRPAERARTLRMPPGGRHTPSCVLSTAGPTPTSSSRRSAARAAGERPRCRVCDRTCLWRTEITGRYDPMIALAAGREQNRSSGPEHPAAGGPPDPRHASAKPCRSGRDGGARPPGQQGGRGGFRQRSPAPAVQSGR